MHVDLDPQLEALVREQVESGRYSSADEVVREAVRQLAERERRLEELRAAIAVADEQIARGEVAEWTPELRAEIWREAKADAATGKAPKADVLP